MIGQQRLGTVNENGELFLNLSAFNRMVIGVSIFPHTRIPGFLQLTADQILTFLRLF